MNEREKLEMVKMCVDALLEGKELEFVAYNMNGEHWLRLQDISSKNIASIAERIWYSNYKYRIAKPTVKVRYRLYKWRISSFVGVRRVETNEEACEAASFTSFRGWIGDWQEVEIEE
jgi:hypothetical protein